VERAQVILLDTHAAIWLTTNHPSLGKRSRAIAARALAGDLLAVSAISFWEMALLIAKGRLRALRSASEQRQKVLATGIREIAVTGDIAILAVDLNTLHNDPADRLIVATALIHQATLVTADTALLEWSNKLKRQDAQA
jgi:PIN domain nuclease of toxin-antitoxin system